MQVKVETGEGLERRMRVVIPADDFQTQLDTKLRETAGQVKLKGFRPGKVPLREIKRRFGKGIRQEVSSDLIQSTYGEAIEQQSVNPAGMPRIEDVKMEEGQDLEYTAVFDVFPEVQISNLDKIKVERPVSKVGDADIDRMIETLREQGITWQEVDRASQEGDRLSIDYEGSLNGEVLEAAKQEGANLVLGSGQMIPGFEDGLASLAAGEEKQLDLTFPEEYHAKDIQGKEVNFSIKVNTVSEPVKPELDEDFYSRFGVTEGGLAAFRAEVKANMERELESVVRAKLKTQVMDGLAAQHEISLPQSLVDQEVSAMKRQAVQSTLQSLGQDPGMDPDALPSEMFADRAASRVKTGLLVRRLVEQFDIKLDDALVRQRIETLASTYEQPGDVINFYYQQPEHLASIQNLVLEDQVVDFVLESAKVSSKKKAYDDAIKPLPEQGAQSDEEKGFAGRLKARFKKRFMKQ